MWFHSTKFDGSLHYRHRVTEVHRRTGFLAVYLRAGEWLESYRGGRRYPRHLLGLYWTDRHYNVCVIWEADWSPHCYYVNVATPASWADGTLRCIDLDLDVVCDPHGRAIRVDDEDEFALHSRRWAYPASLLATCEAVRSEVPQLMTQSVWPFDGSLFDWRPGAGWPSDERQTG